MQPVPPPRRPPWQQRRDRSVAEELHWQQRRQGSQAITTATTTSLPQATIDVTTAALSPSATVSAPSDTPSASATASLGSPSNTSTSIPEGYTLPQPFESVLSVIPFPPYRDRAVLRRPLLIPRTLHRHGNSSTLGTNFSSTACPSFFATFLADPTFRACAPFSLLLTTSTGFFQAERAPTSLLPYVLDASCSAPLETCTGLMDSLARKIKLQNTCARDWALGNPLVTEAVDGFNNYRLMRSAACQRSNSTGRYCFADAATKADPSDLYLYYLVSGSPHGGLVSFAKPAPYLVFLTFHGGPSCSQRVRRFPRDLLPSAISALKA